jgi:hypothetical protein
VIFSERPTPGMVGHSEPGKGEGPSGRCGLHPAPGEALVNPLIDRAPIGPNLRLNPSVLGSHDSTAKQLTYSAGRRHTDR